MGLDKRNFWGCKSLKRLETPIEKKENEEKDVGGTWTNFHLSKSCPCRQVLRPATSKESGVSPVPPKPENKKDVNKHHGTNIWKVNGNKLLSEFQTSKNQVVGWFQHQYFRD